MVRLWGYLPKFHSKPRHPSSFFLKKNAPTVRGKPFWDLKMVAQTWETERSKGWLWASEAMVGSGPLDEKVHFVPKKPRKNGSAANAYIKKAFHGFKLMQYFVHPQYSPIGCGIFRGPPAKWLVFRCPAKWLVFRCPAKWLVFRSPFKIKQKGYLEKRPGSWGIPLVALKNHR